MHQFTHEVCDRGHVGEIMKGLDQGCFKNTCYSSKPLILCHLHAPEQTLLVDPHVLYLDSICEDRDYKHVVDVSPVYKVKPMDRVA